MAVCGRCWICGEKFDCGELNNCGDCVADQLKLYGKVATPPVVTDRMHDTWNGEQRADKICAACVRDINSGGIGALVHALRSYSLQGSIQVPGEVPGTRCEACGKYVLPTPKEITK